MSQRHSPPFAQSSSDALRYNPPILAKGKACVNCRRRKMRCDGAQPICGSCRKTDRAEDCEYTTGAEQTTSQKLEQEIERLQSRLHHLQTSSQSSHPVTLQQPYVPGHPNTRPSPVFQEPSPNVIRRLADIFLAHASQYGFFLHAARFRSSALLPAPVGHESRPSPSLLSVMYLLGIHLSQDPEIKRHEKSYLDWAVQQVSQDTLSSSTRHPKRILHLIQAEVILSHYFFANKRVLEGKYHLSSAFSLGLASGLHKLGTRNPPDSPLPHVNDHIEEGEQVNAFWSIYCLDKGWAGVLGGSPNIPCPTVGGLRIITPLPRETEEYETGQYQSSGRERATFHDFYSGTEASGEQMSSRMLHVKAVSLFQRARALSRASGTEMSDQQRNEFQTSYSHCLELAVTLKSSMPRLETWLATPNPDTARTALVAVTLLNAALIRLYDIKAARGDENARQLRNFCAQEIFNSSINLASASWKFGYLNSIIGFAWREAFEVLFAELKARTAAQPPWPVRHPASGEDPLRRQLRKGIASFTIYANSCAFIGCEIQEMLTRLENSSI